MGNISTCDVVEEKINSVHGLKLSYYHKRRHNNQKGINYEDLFEDSINQKEKNYNSISLNQDPIDKKSKKLILKNINDKTEEEVDKVFSLNIKNNTFSILKNKIKKLNLNNQIMNKKCEEDCGIIEYDNDDIDFFENMTEKEEDSLTKKIENINVKINNINYKNAKLNEQKIDNSNSIDSIFGKDINMELSTTKNKISEIHSTIFDYDIDDKSVKNLEDFININDALSNYNFINNNPKKVIKTISPINDKNIIKKINISIDEKQSNNKNKDKKIYNNNSYTYLLKNNNICLNCLTERYSKNQYGFDKIINLRKDWIKTFGSFGDLLIFNQISKKKKNKSCENKKINSISEKMKAIKRKLKKENYIKEFQKQKEEQDKKIEVLQEKLNSLYQILNYNQNNNNNNIKKIHCCSSDIYVKKIHSYKSKKNFYHEQLKNLEQKEIEKDNKIKELENKLKFVMETNSKNRFILTQKEKQIQQLLSKNNEQNTIIMKYKKVSENFSNNKNNKLIDACRVYSKSKDFSGYDFNNSIDTSKKNINPVNFCFHKKNLSANVKNENKIFDNFKISKSNSYRKIENQNIKILNTKQQQIFCKKRIGFKFELPNFNSNQKKNINNNRIKNKFKINTILNKNNNNTSTNNHKNSTKNSSITDKDITYSNYCNSLNHKLKNQYTKKINLKKFRVSKINKADKQKQILTKIRNSKKIYNQTKDETDLKTESKFNIINKDITNSQEIKKSKIKNQTVKNEKLKEIYLKAGTVQFETEDNLTFKGRQYFSSIINLNNSTNSDYNNTKNIFNKKFPDLLSSQGSNNSNTNNKNQNILNSINIPPKTSKSNDINFFEKYENKFNNFGNISYNSMKFLTSEPTGNINNSQKIYSNIYNDYVRYKKINYNTSFHDGKENLNYNGSNEFKLNFRFLSGNINLLVNENDIMTEVIDKLLSEFFKRKEYNESEKDYIKNNISFLYKDNIIDKNKSLLDNKIENNASIVPVLKDVT